MANPVVFTPAPHQPVTLAELKHHLRIEQDDLTEDAGLWVTLQAATEAAEIETNRKLVTTTLDGYFDAFPDRDYLELWGGRLQSITSLKYTDSAGSETTWDAANYFADTASEPGRLHLAYGASWPSETLKPANGIVVRYVAGYGRGDQVPVLIKACIKLIAGDLWEHRENTLASPGLGSVTIPYHARKILGQFALRNF